MLDEWDSLDSAAQANLQGFNLKRFYDYKDMLKVDGHAWDGDAEWILRGHIWDSIEDD